MQKESDKGTPTNRPVARKESSGKNKRPDLNAMEGSVKRNSSQIIIGVREPRRHSGQYVLVDPESEGSSRNRQLTDADKDLILTYMQDPTHKSDLFGNNDKTSIGRKPITRTKAWNQLASWFSAQTGWKDITGDSLKRRWATHMRNYRSANTFLKGSGEGLTEQDNGRNNTIAEKLEDICYGYHKTHLLFHKNPTITPTAEFQSATQDGRSFFDEADE
ncbi:hypothetical protein BGZ49_005304 [Haplosporangium sp. Z 27]|nr:hypothetical protein BGZ49_005304 [Haplosporangium sp. Z 27]